MNLNKENIMTTGYNGWTNYETWKTNLEMFDGFVPSHFLDDFDFDNPTFTATEYLAGVLQDITDDFISNEIPEESGFSYSVVQSFKSRVNWEEIAEHYVNEYLLENLRAV